MGTTRIKDLTEATEVQSGDYLAIDNASGTKKVDFGTLAGGTYEYMTAGTAQQLESSGAVENTTPYTLRSIPSPATRSTIQKIVGGTVAWNQLNKDIQTTNTSSNVTLTNNNDGSCTLNGVANANANMQITKTGIPITKDHVYYVGSITGFTPSAHQKLTLSGISIGNGNGGVMKASSTYAGLYLRMEFYSGDSFSNLKVIPQITDLTQMLGSTIADYIYTLESGTAGAGVAKLKSWGFFGKDYYAYDAGSLQSVNTSKKVTRDADENILGEYTLDSDLTLRGIPKLVGSELNYDGDEYLPSGTVTRKYATTTFNAIASTIGYNSSNGYFYGTVSFSSGSGINKASGNTNLLTSCYVTHGTISAIDLADKEIKGYDGNQNIFWKDSRYTSKNDFLTAMGNEIIVYEISPTTESADPYQQTQICDPDGTEEFIDTGATASTPTRDVAIPVGTVTEYPWDLKGKIEQLYGIPKPPTSNGTYALKVTVSGSTITYSWV